jgi:peptidoglycan/LPS O-acetylase OafA/YrhL
LTQLLAEPAPISPPVEFTATPVKPAAARFLFVDGLRGIAACCVMFFHFVASGSFWQLCQARTPHLFATARLGYLGVDIFFVISGFVIAFSVRNEKINGRFVRGFVVRRMLRLDPPYLITIALAVLLLWFYRSGLHLHFAQVPTIRQILVNIFYLTGILKMEPMLPVFWTLCLEVQFYLLFIGTLWAGKVICDRLKHLTPVSEVHRRAGSNAKQLNWFSFPVLVGLGIASACIVGGWLHTFNGWFLNDWNLFVLGCLLWWTIDRKISDWWLIGFAGFLGYAAYCTGNYAGYTGLLTMSAIGIAAMTGKLSTWLSHGPVQFLGKISYSLYLLHPLIGPMIDGPIHHYHPDSVVWSIAGITISVALSIAAAWLMYRYVEVPGIKLGKRLRGKAGWRFQAATFAG